MKTTFFMAFGLMLFCGSVSAQKTTNEKVPTVVSSAFASKFPNATQTKWEMENKNEFEADFNMNNVEYSAKFDKSGKWLETEMEIATTELPATVKQTLANEFPGFDIQEVEKVEKANNKTEYEIKVKKNSQFYEVLLTDSGKILDKKVENEKNND